MLSKFVYAGIVFMGFLAIMNPIAGISIFLTLTNGEEKNKVKNIAKTALITAFTIVVLFSLVGHLLLNLFGVSFTALKLAGGLLVAIIGYDMLQGKSSQFSRPSDMTIQKSKEEESSIAITPLGIPFLAGPGVIITAMNFAAGEYTNLIITILAFGILCLITYFIFVSGEKIKKVLGTSILKVFTRMMGLILLVIGTQMLIEGFYGALQDFPSGKYF